MVAVLTAVSSCAMAVELNVRDFGALADSGEDACPAFQRAFAAAKKQNGAVTLRVPAGVYDFFPDKAHRRKCFTSNSTESNSDGTKTVALDLQGIDHLTIEGAGAKLMMRGKMTMLVAEQCENLKIRGVEFDFKRPTMSEMTAVEKGEDYWLAEVHEDSWYRIEGRQLIWVGEGWETRHNMVQHYDHSSETTWRAGDPTSGASAIVDLGGRKLRFEMKSEKNGLKHVVLGRTYQLRNTRRDAVGMWIHRCKDVAFEDVTVRAMHGFGILGQFSENISFGRLVVAPDPNRGRTNASSADITHFSGCKGTIRISDSVLTHAHDDALNVHGTYLRVLSKEGSKRVKVRFMHAQSWGFQPFYPGDEVQYIHRDSMLPIGASKVKKVQRLNDRELILTMDREVPDEVQLGKDTLENLTWTPEVVLEGCDIRGIPTRGILLSTPKPIRIEGNRFFRTKMSAVLVACDAGSWFESGGVKDLTIKGNLFDECGEPVIRIHPENRKHAGPVHRGIKVLENMFVMRGKRALQAKSTEGIELRGNRFWMRGPLPKEVKQMISLHNSAGLKLEQNRIEDGRKEVPTWMPERKRHVPSRSIELK